MTKRTSHLGTALKQAAADTGLPIDSWEVQRLATAQLCLQQLQHRMNAGSNVGPTEINTAIEAVEAARQAAKRVEPMKVNLHIVEPKELPLEVMCRCCGALQPADHPENVLRSNADLRTYYGLTGDTWSDKWRDAVIAKPPPHQAIRTTPTAITEPAGASKLKGTVDIAKSGAALHRAVAAEMGQPLPEPAILVDPTAPLLYVESDPSARSIHAAAGVMTNPDTGERVAVTPPLKRTQQSDADIALAREHARIQRNNDPRTASHIEPYRQPATIFPIIPT